MKRFFLLIFIVCVAGCTATAIMPAKVTFTYPLGEPFGAYETTAGLGSVAYMDEGSLALVLPHYAPDPLKPAPIKPHRFVFKKTSEKGVWQERKDPELKLRMILEKEQLHAIGSNEVITLNEGMLLVTFPNSDKYGAHAGKRIWMTSTAGPDEMFTVRGIYWKSKANIDDMSK